MIRIIAPPTKYETAPYGTLCTVLLNDEGTIKEIYVQTAAEPNDPIWLSSQELLISVYKEKLTDPEFLADCLEEYSQLPS